jgi:transaldolase
MMTGLQALTRIGQSVWLDNITRKLLDTGTLRGYADEGVSGLTSNPTIFDQAVKGGREYDADIRAGTAAGRSAEDVFFDLALADLVRAADLFRPTFDRTAGADGWVSLEVSPRLARDPAGTLAAARTLFARADRPNLFIKIPGTPEGLPAIEQAVAAGVPVNITLLFSAEQYLAAAEAYLRGVEARIAAGLAPSVGSVASVFVSRWDAAVAAAVPTELRNRLGVAVAGRTYRAYREFLASPRWKAAQAKGARPQRLLWASTGTKDPTAPDTLYVQALAAPDTVNTMPEGTLKAFADHGRVRAVLPADGGDCDAVLGQFTGAGVEPEALAAELQSAGAEAFVASWASLLSVITSRGEALATVRPEARS